MTPAAPHKVEPFPWSRAMGFGFGILQLSPEAFWRMTPRELAAAIRAVAPPRAPALGRGAFDALMRRFPDAAES